jgi:beta-lactamase regulating signal transducer with metallopeptidase domain
MTDSSIIDLLGWTILHFLWQGALIGVVAGMILALLPARLASWRYLTACSALTLCIMIFVATAVHFGLSMNTVAAALEPGTADRMALGAPAMTTQAATVDEDASVFTRVISVAWVIGVLFMSTRFIIGVRNTVRFQTRGIEEVDPGWSDVFNQLKVRLGVRDGIRLLGSSLAETPMVVGWIRPVVLVPVSAFTNLTTDELKLVLLHELNHIRRMDHLINLLQGTAECLLFFHPVTWWLSAQIRNERELCCDDLTMKTMNQPRIFARALVKLETLRLDHRPTPLNPSVHATGGSLMSRINRLLETKEHTELSKLTWRGPLAIALATGLTAICLTTSINPVTAGETMSTEQDRDQGEELEFPTAEMASRRIREEIMGGELTADQGDRMLQVHRRLLMGIDSGKLTIREAYERLEEQAEALYEKGGEKVDEAREEEAMINRMIEMVRAGEISREQMEQRVDRMNMRKQAEDDELDLTIAKVEEMLEAGMITRAQLVDGLRKMMSEFKKPAFTRADYAENARTMQAMVEAGEITREQMQQRLDRMRMAMGATKSTVPTKVDYMEAEKKMTAMVKAGEITKEQMKQRLERMRMAMAEASRQAKAPARVDYMEAEKKMTAMVKAGEITKEQMQQRLDRMKAGMAKDKAETAPKAQRLIPVPPEGLSREELREWFGRMKERLDMAVESGRMTPEEAREMMMKIRSNMR